MTYEIVQNLIDVGCPENSAVVVERLCNAGRLDDAIHRLRLIRCNLMDELHQCQRKIDCLDSLIRQTVYAGAKTAAARILNRTSPEK